jgi:outer membrane receptor protein involved in Fe transport
LTRGIDLKARYSIQNRYGKVTFGGSGTYVIEYSIRHGPGQQLLQLLNTQDQPVSFRGGAYLSWESRGLGASIAVNRTGAYRNVSSTLAPRIPAWTTCDFTLSYKLQIEGRAESELTVGVFNAFNRLSPFVDTSQGGYDPENGGYLGRVLSASVRFAW